MSYAGQKVRVYLTSEQLSARVKALGEKITADLRGKPLVVISIMKGGAMFAADLVRHIDLPMEMEYLYARSYSGSKSTGIVEVERIPRLDLKGKNLLLIEDIIDTGLTMETIKVEMAKLGPERVLLSSMLSKPARRVVEISIDYLGFEIPDEFVVGYGLDYNEDYRNLPYIGIYSET
jgi:hypoxanthine phosphoribosyltransferase